MTCHAINRPLAIGATVVALCAVALSAQTTSPSSLDAVRTLYESAAYDEALSTLDRVSASGASSADSGTLLRYRALCLLALDRSAEAEQAIERLLTDDSSYRPDPGDTSPRFVSLVDRTRNRVIPALARKQYEIAKRDYDQNRRGLAATGFARVTALLSSPALDPSVAASSTDLRMLASGFLELSRSTPADPPAAPASAPAIELGRIYTVADRDVKPPVVLQQELPVWHHKPLGIIGRFEGEIEVVIDARGMVESATLAKSVFEGYDELAVAGARDWKYSPARRGAVPVRYKKRVAVRVTLK
jgi:hypothetical protein